MWFCGRHIEDGNNNGRCSGPKAASKTRAKVRTARHLPLLGEVSAASGRVVLSHS